MVPDDHHINAIFNILVLQQFPLFKTSVLHPHRDTHADMWGDIHHIPPETDGRRRRNGPDIHGNMPPDICNHTDYR